MVRIKRTQHMILATGHAENHDVCGLFSGAASALTTGLDMAGEGDAYEMDIGSLYINLEKIHTDRGRFICDVLMECVKTLSEEYPASFDAS